MRASRKMCQENQRAQSPEGRDCRCQGRRQPRERQDQGWRRNHTAAITDETVEQLKVTRGKTAYAVIKTSDFMVELD
jgi:hypothetical protein